MEKKLKTQLENAQEIKEILKEVNVTFKLANGTSVETLLVYLPIVGGKSCHKAFFDKVKNGILINFVFNCSEVQKKLKIENVNTPLTIFNKALTKLSKHTAQGELGDLILFTLLDVYLAAPKLLSKVAIKTTPTVPYFGADAVHGQYHEGSFRIYLGESKLWQDFKSAATDATKSIKSAKDKYANEFSLLDSGIDFPGMDEETKDELLVLLNPYSSHDLTDVVHSPCFIGFTQPELMVNETEFEKNYIELAGKYIGDFYNKLEKQDLKCNETILIMLPFTCVQELTEGFIAYMGIKQ